MEVLVDRSELPRDLWKIASTELARFYENAQIPNCCIRHCRVLGVTSNNYESSLKECFLFIQQVQ